MPRDFWDDEPQPRRRRRRGEPDDSPPRQPSARPDRGAPPKSRPPAGGAGPARPPRHAAGRSSGGRNPSDPRDPGGARLPRFPAADPRDPRGGRAGDLGATGSWDPPAGPPLGGGPTTRLPRAGEVRGTAGARSGQPRGARSGPGQGGPPWDPPSGPGRGGPGDAAGEPGAGRNGRRRRSWPQRLVLGVGAVLVVLCMLGASVAGYTLITVGNIERVDDLTLPSAAKGEPENFLVVGVDTREGHQTTNTDTIMVVRIDPKSDRVAMTSFPRDLMVRTPDSSSLQMINGVYSLGGGAEGGGEQALIDTIKLNFDITIHHFVEVRWDAFSQVVDAVGGVPVYIPRAVRDDDAGLFIPELGCVNLDGERALAFARSRKLEIQDEDGDWVQDPLSDESRIQRQQIFLQQALFTVMGDVGNSLPRIHELLEIGVQNVRLDANLTLGDMRDLAGQFRDFDPEKLETYYLPVVPWPPDENRRILADAEAEQFLNVFRGVPLGEIRPGIVHVTVLNGTGAGDPAQAKEGLANDVSGALQQIGFQMGLPGDTDTFFPKTTLRHAPGEELFATRVARHITSDVPIPVEVDPDLSPGEVTLIAGADFTTVHQDPTPVDAMPRDPAAEQATTTTTAADSTTTTTDPRPTTTTTEPSDYIVGQRRDGRPC